jgi:hypothetical protein
LSVERDKNISSEKVVQDTIKIAARPNQFFHNPIVNNIIWLIKNDIAKIQLKLILKRHFWHGQMRN